MQIHKCTQYNYHQNQWTIEFQTSSFTLYLSINLCLLLCIKVDNKQAVRVHFIKSFLFIGRYVFML